MLRLQYEKELAQAHVTVQTKFNYAWGLVKSPMREHQVEGVRLLQGAPFPTRCLLVSVLTRSKDLYRAEPTRRRECLYYLALGHYKMGNFDEAKKFNGTPLFCAAVRSLDIHICRAVNGEGANEYAGAKSVPTY